MRNRWGTVLCLLVLMFGCAKPAEKNSDSGEQSQNNSADKTLKIAVIPKGTTHEFWKSVHAGAENAAAELGNVEIFWEGPFKESDRQGQITVVENFITKKVDAIVLAPLDSQALVDAVQQAHDEGIKVVIFDSGLDDESNIVSYVATDNYNGGALAARRMAELLDNKGNAILLRYTPGSESTEQREKGFLETMQKEFPDINIISDNQYLGTTPEEAFDKAQQVLSKHRDEVNGVFAVCEPNVMGTLNALKELELAEQVKLVAFDPSPEIVKGLAEGTVHGVVLQDPVKMGYTAVMAAVKHIRGEDVQKRISTGEAVATPENMKAERMQALLEPEQFGE